MKLSEIYAALESFAPLSFQEEYDNAGLQVGLTDEMGYPSDARCTGVLLTLDVNEAIIDEALAKDCNLILSHHPLIYRPLKSISGTLWQQRCVAKALKRGIAIYSAHTNLDNARGGVNWMISRKLGLGNVRFLVEKDGLCGSGAIGELPAPVTDSQFLSEVQRTFGVDCVLHTALDGRMISRVALCGGSGSFLMDAARSAGADCFITGELGYHQFFDAEGLQMYALGHYQSEKFTIHLLEEILSGLFGTSVRMEETEIVTNPINYGIIQDYS